MIEKYNLMNKVLDGYVYIKTKKGMYGLKQASVSAYDNLVKTYSCMYKRLFPTLWASGSTRPNQ